MDLDKLRTKRAMQTVKKTPGEERDLAVFSLPFMQYQILARNGFKGVSDDT